jgi:uncharacterized protein YjiS (DUF1127 family)
MQYQILCGAAKAGTGELAMAVINLLTSIGRAFSEWRRRERAYAELMALDDHSLADIGIHRSQIGSFVDGFGAPRPPAPALAFPNRENFARRKEA